ncbi:dipeptidyl aminopeptidase [Cordyceps fumosorosea ARSEF 2679]|uniref:Probable dipeptidyl-aminopeptidase B n=1 Tax=Cordyceps fumosorosea (strain ARSEF 2679) TaxID=1081104 RepID=A0A168CFI5_CORFA|nr:dipeptidyl aminopeptidase [Cordyceps fumosorosea ARSEF 2679]OAA71313.1 dipeptidyl aminopeptidase [Cordyceps fumosorosea ARSEF 2679]
MASLQAHRGDTDADDGQPESSSRASLSSASTTSLVFDRLQDEVEKHPSDRKTSYRDADTKYKPFRDDDDDDSNEHDLESGPFLPQSGTRASVSATIGKQIPMDRSLKRVLFIAFTALVAFWCLGLALFLFTGGHKHASESEHDPDANSRGSGKAVTLDQVQSGYWYPNSQSISWVASPDGQDGLLLEQGTSDLGHLVVEDVRNSQDTPEAAANAVRAQVLMKESSFKYDGKQFYATRLTPSPDLKSVLIAVEQQKNWRHSFTAVYYILDVETQGIQPLVPWEDDVRVQLATWSPQSDAIAFTRDNNMYIRHTKGSKQIVQVTKDGGPEYFYGIPDWVYEEEVFGGNSATWWSADGKYLAFLRTNETGVPEYPVQYFRSRPSGSKPAEGEEAYPDVVNIKYPKAGSHNPVVDLLLFDVDAGEVFSAHTEGEFSPDDRIINNVLWAGDKLLVKETNRVSDFLKVLLIDVSNRKGKVVNSVNVNDIDGGWFEISHTMTYVPADWSKGRRYDGYIDGIIHDGYEHIGYFTPLNNSEPVLLTSGPWEVENAPSAVDLDNNLVYFVATKESSIQRHVYSVKLDGSELAPFTDTSEAAYYGASFSSGAGYALLSNRGPKVPTQRIVATPSNAASYSRVLEDNAELADRARKHALPLLNYGTVNVSDGVALNYVERRPPHFDPSKTYPVLFQQYSGPNSQTVTKRFAVDFQSYVAANLGYVVVTVDPRGTGFKGRAHRVAVRGQLGVVEAQDHIAAARHFAARPYVDPARLALWGWSYGGFQTLKTLEADAGATFSYGMAVAPVTDWRFYDSIYTERYMRTPQDNPDGYTAARVGNNATALGGVVRFLLMHGSADDNVHFQNSLTLLDDLDLAGVENFDVHVFPDSDHSISFHNGNKIMPVPLMNLLNYPLTQKNVELNNWLINAFNGEWLKVAHPKPNPVRRFLERLGL